MAGSLSRKTFFRNKALFGREAVCAIVFDAVRDVEVVVHLAQHRDEQIDFFFDGFAAQADEVCNFRIAFCSGFIFRVEFDDLRQVHRVCSTMDDVCAVIRECSAGLVSHRVHDAQECVGENAMPARHCALCIRARASVSPL